MSPGCPPDIQAVATRLRSEGEPRGRDPLDSAGAHDGRYPTNVGRRRRALGPYKGVRACDPGAVEVKPDIALAELRDLLGANGFSKALSGGALQQPPVLTRDDERLAAKDEGADDPRVLRPRPEG